MEEHNVNWVRFLATIPTARVEKSVAWKKFKVWSIQWYIDHQPWSHDLMISWSLDLMISWSHDLMILWSYEMTVTSPGLLIGSSGWNIWAGSLLKLLFQSCSRERWVRRDLIFPERIFSWKLLPHSLLQTDYKASCTIFTLCPEVVNFPILEDKTSIISSATHTLTKYCMVPERIDLPANLTIN